jgi:hypothetical protein
MKGKFSGWQIVADLQLQMYILNITGLRIPEKLILTSTGLLNFEGNIGPFSRGGRNLQRASKLCGPFLHIGQTYAAFF